VRRSEKAVLKKSALSCPDQGELVLFLLERVRCGLGGDLRPERWRVEVVKWAKNSRNGAFWGDTKPLGEVPERVVARLVRPVRTPQRPFLRNSFIAWLFMAAVSGNRHHRLSFERNQTEDFPIPVERVGCALF
jgi:hypothetical protein